MQTCEQYLTFDPYQFAGRMNRPVHAELGTDGEIRSTGIAFEDYDRMHTRTHKLAPSRKLQTPTWAVNDRQFQQVIARYIERRANRGGGGLAPMGAGTPAERIARAEQHIRTTAPQHVETLKMLGARYMAMKRDGAPATALRELEIQIENVDTSLRMVTHPAATVSTVAYFFYRCGFDSVGVAQRCHLKPPHVRQIHFRLNAVAAELGFAPAKVKPATVPPVKHVRGPHQKTEAYARMIARWYAEGKTYQQVRALTGGMAENTILRLLRQYGLYTKRPLGPNPTFDTARAADLLAQGLSYGKAAQKLGLSEKSGSSLRRVMLRRGCSNGRPSNVQVHADRAALVASPEFVALFERARLRMHNPNRVACKRGHPICTANAHVGDLRRMGTYACDLCNQIVQAAYHAKKWR